MAFKPMRPTNNPPQGTFEMRSALSPSEERLFFALIEAVGNSYFVFPKMSLREIIRNTHRFDFDRISRKSVDFMIYERSVFQPKCAIELDDHTHEVRINKERDQVKDYYLNVAGIPVIRLPVYEKFLPKRIRDMIITAKADTTMEYPIPPIVVEVEEVDLTDSQ